jgi:hypothetical protein
MSVCQAKFAVLGKKEASGVWERLCSRYYIKAKELGKENWETMDGDFKWWGSRWASIASKTLLPTEPPMGKLGSGLHMGWW